MVVVTVRDFGPGISTIEQSRVFEPFYTTKAVGQGTGLGLSLVYSLVNGNDGKISIDNSVTKGTRFELLMPQFDSSATDADNDKLLAREPDIPTNHRGYDDERFDERDDRRDHGHGDRRVNSEGAR